MVTILTFSKGKKDHEFSQKKPKAIYYFSIFPQKVQNINGSQISNM